MIYLIIRRSMLLIVLLKVGKLVKLTEVGRLLYLISISVTISISASWFVSELSSYHRDAPRGGLLIIVQDKTLVVS